jgi:ABC-type polysaccharide/polyol phosphate transport system ATPase subunit
MNKSGYANRNAAQEPSISVRGVDLSYPVFRGRHGLFTPRIKKHGRTEAYALRGIDIDLHAGDRLAVLGSNGAGKSTLLRVLAGIFPPSRGSVESHGSISLLLDSGFGLDDSQTGLANIKTYAILNALSRTKTMDLVNFVVGESGLGDALNAPVRTYSTGMVTRLVFSLATAQTPEILIMDEALSTGDISFRKQAETRLKLMMEEASIMIAASHDLTFLEETCSSGALLDRGHLELFGTVAEAVSAYKERVLGEAHKSDAS